MSDSRIRKVALFTSNFQPWGAGDLFSQGACAYLSKALTSTELVQALQDLHAGKVLIAPDARSAQATKNSRTERGEVLTDREAQVLSLISQGLSNTEISIRLHLSVNTVKSYIRSCYRKIEVGSRSTAVLWGLSRGFGAITDLVPHRQGSSRPFVRAS